MLTDSLLDPPSTNAQSNAQGGSGAAQPLPVGHRMGELEITGVLGIGGFGIVYRAFDHALQRVVAIKEYMPGMLAVRRGDLTVSLRSERHAATFQAGQTGFINEARLLAQFDHPCLIKVLRFWEDHGTAYMATPFYEGQTLKQRLSGGRALAEGEILRLLAALLGALETLHRAQCFHRDIALDNILIQPDGRPVLLDFGAARKLIGDLVDDNTIMLKPGYAPIEQYTDDPAFRQGPWTDLYALGAVIHVLVSGELPPAAVVRSIQDSYVPLAGRALGYSPRLLQAADRALQVRIEDRPQNVVAFAGLLGLQADAPGQYSVPEPTALPVRSEPVAETPLEPLPPAEPPAPSRAEAAWVEAASVTGATTTPPVAPVRSRKVFWLIGLAAVVVVAGVAFVLLQMTPRAAQPAPAPTLRPLAAAPLPTRVPLAELPTPAPLTPAAPVAASVVADVAPQPTAQPDQDALDWKQARAANTVASYQHYLQQYVGGTHEAEARRLLAAAEARQAPAATDKPAPAAKNDIPLAEGKPVDEIKPGKAVPVQLHIQPWGEVYVAGKKRGVSPPLKTLSLAPGSYEIEIRNGQLPPYRTQLVVPAGASDSVIEHRFE